VDYSWGRPNLAELARLGKRFIIRYVSFDRTGKNLTKAEADAARAAGLSIVTNWEWDRFDQLGGRTRGVEHAREADRLHRAAGGPPEPIYFSTDFNATATQLATCYAYLEGAASVLGWGRVGCYGGRRTIDFMATRGVRWLWQTYAWSGFSPLSGRFDEDNTRWHPAAAIHQYNNGVRVAGADCDLNRAMKTDYGQWGQEEDDVTKAEVLDALQEYFDRDYSHSGLVDTDTMPEGWHRSLKSRIAYAGMTASPRSRARFAKDVWADPGGAKVLAGQAAILAAVAGDDVAAAVRAELAAHDAAMAQRLAGLPAALAELVPAASAEQVEVALRTVLLSGLREQA
jgi:hypothetical protein